MTPTATTNLSNSARRVEYIEMTVGHWIKPVLETDRFLSHFLAWDHLSVFVNRKKAPFENGPPAARHFCMEPSQCALPIIPRTFNLPKCSNVKPVQMESSIINPPFWRTMPFPMHSARVWADQCQAV